MRGMNSLASWNAVGSGAWSQWQAALADTGWHPMAMALAQSGVALVSLAAARHAAQPALWRRSAGLLLVLALASLLSLDLLLVELARALAHAGGWYGARRSWQALALVLLAVLGLAMLAQAGRVPGGLRPWPGTPIPTVGPERWLPVGLGVVLAVTALRLVSLHDTDALLGLRVSGWSVGRLLEGAGLLVIGGRAAWLVLLDRG